MSDVKQTTGAKTVKLSINGTPIGDVPATGTLKEFANAQAKNFGIRTFCVMSGGQAVKKDEGDKAVSEFQSIEINAKDSRGSF